jgi:hypothetical protein
MKPEGSSQIEPGLAIVSRHIYCSTRAMRVWMCGGNAFLGRQGNQESESAAAGSLSGPYACGHRSWTWALEQSDLMKISVSIDIYSRCSHL